MAPDPALASMRKIATRADVYPPAEDSFLLVDALAEIWRDELATARPRLCVEIGTGSGYVACSCALLAVKHGCGGWTRTRASDVNPSAVEACRETCAAHGVDEEACATARGDLLTPHEEAIAEDSEQVRASSADERADAEPHAPPASPFGLRKGGGEEA